jgi:very-short-patch-repair endonuclease
MATGCSVGQGESRRLWRVCFGMRNKVARSDKRIARIGNRQHGVVSLRQLEEAGLSRSSVVRRVEAGRLHRIHRGVYAVGHPGISQHGRWMAATLACGDGAAVSHRSAAALWDLLKPIGGSVEVSIRGYGGRARRPGIRLHRRESLSPANLTRRHGIPVTKPSQTIVDLRGAVPEAEVRRAIRQAAVLGLALGGDTRHDRTRSDLEHDFLRICRRYRLPMPEVNVEIGQYEADFVWCDPGFVVETDGYKYHRGQQAFREDRRRDLELRSLGFEVQRLSEEQIDEEPRRVAAILREVLSSARHRVEHDGRGQR